MVTTRVLTDEDLMRLPKDGHKHELVDGEIRVSPAGGRHGKVIMRLAVRLWAFVDAGGLGEVLSESTGFRMPGGNVRSPDVSFVSRDRLPGGQVPAGFLDCVPDLVVEVLSPEDRPREVLDKVGEYLAGGARRVWVIDPEARRAAVYRSLTEVREIPEPGSLEGEDVLPGFSCPLATVLE